MTKTTDFLDSFRQEKSSLELRLCVIGGLTCAMTLDDAIKIETDKLSTMNKLKLVNNVIEVWMKTDRPIMVEGDLYG